uniref:Transmembrane protein 26 n=1 Tax=Sinocyclocheilus grahami TaxID=75366 RepID=A0A672RZV0_SINGR
MILVKFVRAIITRSLFILISLIGVWRVKTVKNDNMYWLLIVLYLPLVVEMIITLKRRKGKDYKWFSPAILLFLISIIPSIWILELHHQENKASDPQVLFYVPILSVQFWNFLPHMLTNVCPNDWILGLHQVLLILLILGKWLLPLGGVTRDELSQLLLIFVGTAADILEFTSETLSDIKENNHQLVYVILAVWTWSMLQFPLHLAVVTSRPQNSDEPKDGHGCCNLVFSRHSTDIWNIVESSFIQDGPFLVVRLIVMTYFDVFHQMLVFFAIKNFLVVVLNLYRLIVICQDFKPPQPSSSSTSPPV